MKYEAGLDLKDMNGRPPVNLGLMDLTDKLKKGPGRRWPETISVLLQTKLYGYIHGSPEVLCFYNHLVRD